MPALLDLEGNPFSFESLAELNASVLIPARPDVAQIRQGYVGSWLGKFGNQIHIAVGTVCKSETIFGGALRAEHVDESSHQRSIVGKVLLNAQTRHVRSLPAEGRGTLHLDTRRFAVGEDFDNIFTYEKKMFDLPIAINSKRLVVEPLEPFRVLNLERRPWQFSTQ